MIEETRTREELAWPYDHLFRHSAVEAWREEEVLRRTLAESIFDSADAARAAEQLLEAQSTASLYETRAARAARAAWDRSQDDALRGLERRGMAAALQQITGQRRRSR